MPASDHFNFIFSRQFDFDDIAYKLQVIAIACCALFKHLRTYSKAVVFEYQPSIAKHLNHTIQKCHKTESCLVILHEKYVDSMWKY